MDVVSFSVAKQRGVVRLLHQLLVVRHHFCANKELISISGNSFAPSRCVVGANACCAVMLQNAISLMEDTAEVCLRLGSIPQQEMCVLCLIWALCL